MDPLTAVILAMVMIGLPVVGVTLIASRWLKLKERSIELEAGMAAEKAAQYAASNASLEARVRVLEKIATDGGVQTAAQIEGLRDSDDLLPKLVTRN